MKLHKKIKFGIYTVHYSNLEAQNPNRKRTPWPICVQNKWRGNHCFANTQWNRHYEVKEAADDSREERISLIAETFDTVDQDNPANKVTTKMRYESSNNIVKNQK